MPKFASLAQRFIGLATFGLLAVAAPAQVVDSGDRHAAETLLHLEPNPTVAQRLAWWSDARFGLFIHWGLYSQWGCHYPGPDGKMLNGGSEHMMQRLKIPLADYAKIADVFDPVKFEAEQWVQTAKDAGMKYLILTAKHHDGFAMFDSPSSGYDIVHKTPFKRDPVAELAVACRKGGIKFGVYYSLGRDWQDPDVPTRNGYRSNTWDYPDESKKVFARYFERKVKPQVRELLTQYGPIAMMWFDTPEEISKDESIELLRLIHQLQPDCIVNQRVGNRYGDYMVAEQKIPATGFADPWETCMTLNRHWGYFEGDQDWKTPTVLIRNLVDIASKGGNFLLNVGPTGQGVMPAGSIEHLHAVGAWLRVNGPAIYGTTGGPWHKLPWGRSTERVSPQGTQVFLHVFEWPRDGRLAIPAAPGTVRSARLLASGEMLPIEPDKAGLVVILPHLAADPISSTVELKLSGNSAAQL